MLVQPSKNLAEWVHEIGVDDPELRPNHAWRHTFKQIADRNGISERVSDAITGHAPLNAARSYGRSTPTDTAEALKRLPRYKVRLSQVSGHNIRVAFITSQFLVHCGAS
jgi:integrase